MRSSMPSPEMSPAATAPTHLSPADLAEFGDPEAIDHLTPRLTDPEADVADAAVVLGYIDPGAFLGGDVRLDAEAAAVLALALAGYGALVAVTTLAAGAAFDFGNLAELLLTGRFIHAQRALATGLVSEVVPDADLAQAAEPYLREMLTTSPMGLRLTKEGLNMAIDAAGLEAAMAIENRNQLMCSSTQDAKEGMRAFIEKRDPVYSGR